MIAILYEDHAVVQGGAALNAPHLGLSSSRTLRRLARKKRVEGRRRPIPGLSGLERILAFSSTKCGLKDSMLRSATTFFHVSGVIRYFGDINRAGTSTGIIDDTVFVSSTWMASIMKGPIRLDRQALLDFFLQQRNKGTWQLFSELEFFPIFPDLFLKGIGYLYVHPLLARIEPSFGFTTRTQRPLRQFLNFFTTNQTTALGIEDAPPAKPPHPYSISAMMI
jgi:hypothetical protein